MNNNEYRFLFKEWKMFLSENINLKDKSKLDRISKLLNDKIKETIDYLSSEDYDKSGAGLKDLKHYLFQHLENITYNLIKSNDLKYVGDGESRIGYEIVGTPLVLKLAKNIEGAKNNSNEVRLGFKKDHGEGAFSGFVEIYDYDKLNQYSWWVIAQKVNQLKEINDIEKLKNIFPTFWNCLGGSNNFLKKDSKTFKTFVTSCLYETVFESKNNFIKNKKEDINRLSAERSTVEKDVESYRNYKLSNRLFPDKGKQDIIKLKSLSRRFNIGNLDSIVPSFEKETLYRVIRKYFYRKSNTLENVDFKKEESYVLPFKEVVFYKDYERLKYIFSYVSTSDLHDENIGLLNVENPKPQDIVILDFDMTL